MTSTERMAALNALADKRILITDGGAGTEFQKMGLVEEDYRGDVFPDVPENLKGNHDVLNLTRPDLVRKLHDSYFASGSDFAGTNTFSCNAIAQQDYALEGHAAEMAAAGARIACEAADHWAEKTGSPKFVLGSLGPTNKTLSISSNVNDPGHRDVAFDEIYDAYAEQIRAMQPYIDLFLIETITDTLNAKAAIKAILDLRAENGIYTDIVISGTITDASGRTLSGQTTEAFWHSVRHAKPWAIGLNCALGAKQLRAYVTTLAKVASTRILTYPNAGLPNEFGEYDERAEQTAGFIGEWADEGLVNLVGGCCGTTPAHIKAIAERVSKDKPRVIPAEERALKLSGLEPFKLVS